MLHLDLGLKLNRKRGGKDVKNSDSDENALGLGVANMTLAAAFVLIETGYAQCAVRTRE